MDPLRGFERNELCWCGSKRKYKSCHGWFNPSAPGAAVPASNEDGVVFISPNTKLNLDGVKLPAGGAPIVDNSTSPSVPAPFRDESLEALAQAVASMPEQSLGDDFTRRLNHERWEILREFGLDEPDSIDRQVAALGDAGTREVVNEILSIAVRMTAGFADQAELEPYERTVLWVGRQDPRQIAAETLLWADHYVVDDELASLALEPEGTIDASRFVDAIDRLHRFGRLHDTGVVVPVLQAPASLLAASQIREVTGQSLADEGVVAWTKSQIRMEGPTAKEVLLPRMADDDQASHPYMFSRIEERDHRTGQFKQSMLKEYDPGFDYGPWIATVENQYTAARIHEVHQNNAIARLFGGSYMTKSPFEARLQRRIGASGSPVQELPFLEVPWVPQLSADDLADFAMDNDVVESIRRQIRLATRRTTDPIDRAVRLGDLIDELASGVELLDRSIRRSRSLGVMTGAAEIGAVLIGAVSLPGVGIAAVLTAVPYLHMRRGHRSQPSFMFWQAQQRQSRRGRSAGRTLRSTKRTQR